MKYRFDLIYQNKLMKQVSELMGKLDLDIGEAGIKETCTLTTSEEREVSFLKDLLTQAFESAECTILHIEGGKVE